MDPREQLWTDVRKCLDYGNLDTFVAKVYIAVKRFERLSKIHDAMTSGDFDTVIDMLTPEQAREMLERIQTRNATKE